jgi:hypothetical protein
MRGKGVRIGGGGGLDQEEGKEGECIREKILKQKSKYIYVYNFVVALKGCIQFKIKLYVILVLRQEWYTTEKSF